MKKIMSILFSIIFFATTNGLASFSFLSATTSVASSTLCGGTSNVPIYAFNVSTTFGGGFTLTELSFTTAGSTYSTSDISAFHLYFNTVNNFSTATLVSGANLNALPPGIQSFTGISQFIPSSDSGLTGPYFYFWITCDINSGSGNHNVSVSGPLSSSVPVSSTNTSIAGNSITFHSAPGNITGSNTICTGSTTTLSNGIGGGLWSSSNTTIATISPSGTVFGISGGVPNIIYALPDGCLSTTTVLVNVSPMDITSASEVCTGITTVLIDSAESGTWTSSDTTIARVSEYTTNLYELTGMSAGIAIISFSNSCGPTVTQTVTVDPRPGAITGIISVCIGATTALSDSTARGVWSSSNANAIVDSAGTVTGITAGCSTITYMSVIGCFITTMVTVTPCITQVPTAPNLSNAENVLIYPNPTFGDFTIRANEAGELKIYNIQGQEIISYRTKAGETSLKLPSALPAGLYICRYSPSANNSSPQMVRLIYQQ